MKSKNSYRSTLLRSNTSSENESEIDFIKNVDYEQGHIENLANKSKLKRVPLHKVGALGYKHSCYLNITTIIYVE